MENRKELILNTIIREHIKTGAPVGSGVLVEKYKLDISPATVRNEMAALEEEGYIAQPHTSAGRIPTEEAYNKYLANLKIRKLKDSETRDLDRFLAGGNEAGFKNVAKVLAGKSGNAVFWAFHKNNLFYTGISNLFKQPEFANTNLIYDISTIIDRVDEIIAEIYNEIKMGEQILLGSANPFGNFCSTVMAKYKLKDNIGMFGILGPMRMDYEKNLALVKYVNERVTRNA